MYTKNYIKFIYTYTYILYMLYIYTPELVRKGVGGFKYKIMCIFNTDTPKQIAYERGEKLSKPRKQNVKNPIISEEDEEIIKGRIIRDIWKLFETEEEKEEREELEGKK